MTPWEEWLQTSNSPEFLMTERTVSPLGRHQIELEKLVSIFRTIAISHVQGWISNIGGSVRTASGHIRDFRIDVPGGYPYHPPRAYAVNWDPGPLHTYSRNELCLWRPEQWTPSYTLAYAVGKTFIWIHKHDVYLSTRRWPGKEQTH